MEIWEELSKLNIFDNEELVKIIWLLWLHIKDQEYKEKETISYMIINSIVEKVEKLKKIINDKKNNGFNIFDLWSKWLWDEEIWTVSKDDEWVRFDFSDLPTPKVVWPYSEYKSNKDAAQQQEPSMEDILASITRILAEDEQE